MSRVWRIPSGKENKRKNIVLNVQARHVNIKDQLKNNKMVSELSEILGGRNAEYIIRKNKKTE